MPLVTVETIYGGGRFAVELIGHVVSELGRRGHSVSQHASPSVARAVLAGATHLAVAKKLESFSRSNYLFDLSTRAAVCTRICEDRAEGRISLCKNFTLADIVNARMFGLEWRGAIQRTEKFSRTVWLDHHKKVEVVPDLVVFTDVPVPVAQQHIKCLLDDTSESSLLRQVDSATGRQVVDYFQSIDLSHQRHLFAREVSEMPNNLVLDAELSAEYNCQKVVDRIEALLL